MKRRVLSIFGKVFLYTVLILLLLAGSLYLFFSNQIKTAVTVTQQLQAAQAFQPLMEQLRNKSNDEIIAFAQEFAEKNRSFSFRFEAETGEALYETEGFIMPEDVSQPPGGPLNVRRYSLGQSNLRISPENQKNGLRTFFLAGVENGVGLYVASTLSGASVYGALLEKAVWVFGLILLGSLLAAFLFARRIAGPIQKVSRDTHTMSLLLPVEAPKKRNDEIGQLAADVYSLYGKLKSAIGRLETEIEHVKALEETQRYFFAAASHELKTPIAAASGILEGILDDVITPEETPAYLRECMKLLREQSGLVSEILDIVKLSGTAPTQEMERVELDPFIQQVLGPLMPLIEAKAQYLVTDIDSDAVCRVNTGLFSKALSNVLRNAVQNSPSGAEVRVTAQELPEHLSVSIWNSGTQIPNELLPKLFEPFYRADEARTSGEGRSGLGLVIVKKALDLMDIPFKISNVDDGVLFRMELPKG